VKLNGKWGFIDKTDTLVIPLIYDMADDFHDCRAEVILNGQKGFIDTKGRFYLTDIEYDKK
jgi:hypothetical protein